MWTKIFLACPPCSRREGMGYFARRVVGYIVFLTVLGVLSTMAVNADDASGGTLLAGTGGAVTGIAILFVALLCSFGVRWTMRRRVKLRRRLHVR